MIRILNVKPAKPIFVAVMAFVLCAFFTFPAHAISDDERGKETFVVVIDPGHGGKIPGARGRKVAEKDIVLDVSKKLKELLEEQEPSVKVILTRDTDVDVPFKTRSDIANRNKANLFISIHANSADRDVRVRNKRGRYVTTVKRAPHVRGTETFVLGFHRSSEQDVAIRENADLLLEDNYEEEYGFDPKDPSTYIIFQLMRNQYRKESIKLASLIQGEYVKSALIDRGVKELGLAVLAKAAMPAVLTEIGFISSPEEEDYMISQQGQIEIAQNLANAIKAYKAYMRH
ncbi:N-acetylmuramoyl-L-alanine amidase [Sphingobacterium sp. SGR-19]|uniref:N-acetylmuramoyl-L-alanine amidase family protein n=1 Tax=Sphingobacterium sp. SGR-19 TaxID=2710886 RepID=UPI0013EAFE72|nr:N-acetylmuramoyl-L-alanine amidase [Sphingobacterium sp. SGR-19]NGM67163.1 N-acetylmuramoyl-L-alanine amidase [Sphingobacterium sp. SGR-19]